MAEELKPCPFCGGAATVVDINTSQLTKLPLWAAGCFDHSKCPVESSAVDPKRHEAVAAWNTRKGTDHG